MTAVGSAIVEIVRTALATAENLPSDERKWVSDEVVKLLLDLDLAAPVAEDSSR